MKIFFSRDASKHCFLKNAFPLLRNEVVVLSPQENKSLLEMISFFSQSFSPYPGMRGVHPGFIHVKSPQKPGKSLPDRQTLLPLLFDLRHFSFFSSQSARQLLRLIIYPMSFEIFLKNRVSLLIDSFLADTGATGPQFCFNRFLSLTKVSLFFSRSSFRQGI